MNAIRDLEEIALHDLDTEEKGRIQKYLSESDPDNPLIAELRDVLDHTDLVPVPPRGWFRRLKSSLRSLYREITSLRRFQWVVIICFLGQMVASFLYVIKLVVSEQSGELSFVDWAQLASSLVSALFILGGIACIRKSRFIAFQMFERSILISIFVTRVFVFYEEQFGAIVGLIFDLLILLALRFMIEYEERMLIENENL